MPTENLSRSEPAGERRRAAFEQLAEPLRREIRVHCYRMLGSLHEAEDLVQETYLRAWRSFDSFRDGSFRSWLYRIATNACLNALSSRKHGRRVLPEQLGPSTDKMPHGPPPTEVYWLEPIPDSYLERIADDRQNPEARLTARDSVRLAFVAAIQQLPPRQRAALLLCDVLEWSAADAAALLDGTVASVNSALQRARKTLSGGPPEPAAAGPAQQETLDKYLKAWEAHDLDGFAALLKGDAVFAMPPYLQWYAGRETIRSFFEVAWTTCNGLRLVPTAANGQPAFGVYTRAGTPPVWVAQSLQVLTMEDGQISKLTAFLEPTGPALFEAFGLAAVLDDNRT